MSRATESSAMSFRPLLPAGFDVPLEWRGRHCVAVPAAPRWVALDYAAVMASRESLHGLFGAGDDWPQRDLSREQDEADLAWHEDEFHRGASFAYSLFSLDMQRCVGCLYLYPTASLAHDAEAYLWAATTEPEEIREAIENEVIQWLEQAWPFQAIAWPGRRISFAEWDWPNYYAACRGADSVRVAG